jgi:hypothetical protein
MQNTEIMVIDLFKRNACCEIYNVSLVFKKDMKLSLEYMVLVTVF